MPASLTSRNTSSQPVSTTGEMPITSSFMAMNVRNALNLVFLLLLPVGKLQLDAQVVGGLLHGHGIGDAPLALRADLRIADDQVLVGLRPLD